LVLKQTNFTAVQGAYMVSERLCQCGKNLSSISKSPLCRGCREDAEKKQRIQLKNMKREQRRINGVVLVHNCIVQGMDPYDHAKCQCRKFIRNRDEVKRLMETGEIVDLETRKESYALNVTDVMTVGKRRQVPRASALSTAHIERATHDFHADLEKK